MHVGVVIAARNAASWIGDAVGSVRAQVHRDWRLAIVDDGSDDETGELAIRWAGGDPRIIVIRQRRAGVSAARNRGAGALGGAEALLFLDADDWLAPHALGRMSEALGASRETVASGGICAFMRERDCPGSWPQRLLYPPPAGNVLERLLERNLFANCGQVLIRAEAIARAGPFRTGLAFGEDWEFLVRLAVLGRFGTLAASEMPTLFVRRRAGGAFLSQATRPDAVAPCIAAIFTDPAVLARVPASRLQVIRARADTECLWTSGRALLAQGRRLEGCVMLGRGLMRRPSARRAAFALAAALLPRFGLAA